MSYDLRIAVKVDGTDILAVVAEPRLSSPTYNLRDMFVACMDWDYEQGVFYPVAEVLPKIERGVHELRYHPEKYRKYNPDNGWGNLDGALRCLESVLECIRDTVSGASSAWAEIPVEHLWIAW